MKHFPVGVYTPRATAVKWRVKAVPPSPHMPALGRPRGADHARRPRARARPSRRPRRVTSVCSAAGAGGRRMTCQNQPDEREQPLVGDHPRDRAQERRVAHRRKIPLDVARQRPRMVPRWPAASLHACPCRDGTRGCRRRIAARRYDASFGMPLNGTLGVVIVVNQQGGVWAARPVMEDLIRGGVLLSRPILDRTLAFVGE